MENVIKVLAAGVLLFLLAFVAMILFSYMKFS
jgi:hypothetical protein